MAFTRPSMVNSSGLSTNGTVVTKEFLDAIFDELDAIIGDPVNVTPASSGYFTATGAMTWTVDAGDVSAFRYQIINKKMTVWFALVTTTVGGTPAAELRITLPANKVAAAQADDVFHFIVGGTSATGIMQVNVGGNVIRLLKDAFGVGTWANSTNNVYVWGQIEISII